jgi:hypothetical protein
VLCKKNQKKKQIVVLKQSSKRIHEGVMALVKALHVMAVPSLSRND